MYQNNKHQLSLFETLLTEDFKKMIVTFLNGCDAQQLSGTCRTLRSDLCIHTFTFDEIWSWDFVPRNDSVPICGPQIPILALRETFTITVLLDPKEILVNKLYIVGHEDQKKRINATSKNNDTYEFSFSSGRVLWESNHRFSVSIYSNSTDRKQMIHFQPRQNEVIHLWYEDATLGKDTLFQMKVYETIFDSNGNHSIVKAHETLKNHGMILHFGSGGGGDQHEEEKTRSQMIKLVTFNLEMLSSILQCLLEQLQTKELQLLDPILLQFLQTKGIEFDKHAFLTLLKLSSRLQNYKYEMFGRLPHPNQKEGHHNNNHYDDNYTNDDDGHDNYPDENVFPDYYNYPGDYNYPH